MEIKVQGTAREVTYTLTSEEAQDLIDELMEGRNEPSLRMKQFLGPLFAVAGRREFGGH